MTDQNAIRVAAVVVLDRFHRVLTVRKEGTDRFMQPGGKPELHESPQQTAVREVSEEIGLHLEPAQLVDMGTFRAQAANEKNTAVICHNFLVEFDDAALDLLDSLQPAAEIAELRWFALDSLTPAEYLAPLLTEQVAPAVRELLAMPDSATR
ncbi:NUDIX domain-containing protein [Nesterenkonia salmonea]|uniref:NUDIX domain-containing protein n=1 Tax=Nesterenkonia salmonea TaxID=1804987 RepID=A0A5R9BA32_9MICC|nr:NUDIX domain-containing protein [Nesterenkonia salmonea]TLP96383.1 NUDIX domain-containing protein [Nesterenkonia salmonea]